VRFGAAPPFDLNMVEVRSENAAEGAVYSVPATGIESPARYVGAKNHPCRPSASSVYLSVSPPKKQLLAANGCRHSDRGVRGHRKPRSSCAQARSGLHVFVFPHDLLTAEAFIEQAAAVNGYPIVLLQITQTPNLGPVLQAAAIAFKNFVHRRWVASRSRCSR
jgi:hypothetical protein